MSHSFEALNKLRASIQARRAEQSGQDEFVGFNDPDLGSNTHYEDTGEIGAPLSFGGTIVRILDHLPGIGKGQSRRQVR